MPWIVAVGLAMLWLALLVVGASFGGLIHLLLVPAFAILVRSLPRSGDTRQD